jgi:hypothetical protein
LGAPIIDPKDLGGAVSPTPAPTAKPAPSAKPGKSPLQQVGDAVDGAYRNVKGAYTSAARDPVGALNNVLGSLQGGVVGAAMAPDSFTAMGQGAWRGMTDPRARAQYNQQFADAALGGPLAKNATTPQRLLRAGQEFGIQTATDPTTYAGGAIAKGALKYIGKPVAEAVARAAPQAIANIKDLAGPEATRAAGVLASKIGKANPIPGIVNAGKDVMFLNPFPHGLGNMTTLNYLANGIPTAAKGLYYGVRGAPRATQYELERMGAGAWTPTLLDEPSPFGPVGWMKALGKRGVPAAVRAAGGGAAGGAIADKTAPSTDTTQQRLTRDLEGTILGGLTGASPEVLNASNRIMSRLETGHRAAMLESLPKPAAAAKVKPKYSASEVAAYVARRKTPEQLGPALSTTANRAARGSGLGSPNLFQHGMKVDPPVDPRAAIINHAFGGGEKGPLAKIATAVGGPFAQYQGEVVPRAVGGALAKAPARVEALARGQDIVNRDVIGKKPYKMQVGGPVGGFSEMVFDPIRYGTRLMGPLANQDPSAATNPKSLSLKDDLRGAAYEGIPGRSIVGPAFGDTMYPTKAPAVPSAALNNLLGWHFSNKTPRQDAILSIMRSSGLDATEAGYLYDRMKPR